MKKEITVAMPVVLQAKLASLETETFVNEEGSRFTVRFPEISNAERGQELAMAVASLVETIGIEPNRVTYGHHGGQAVVVVNGKDELVKLGL